MNTQNFRAKKVPTLTNENEVLIGQVICHNGTPTNSKICARIDPAQDPSPGRIYGIKGKNPSNQDILILVRIEKMWENNPHEDALSSNISNVIPIETAYSKEGDSTVIYRVFEADTLEEVVYKDNERENGQRKYEAIEISSVTTLPRSGWPIIEVPDEIVAQALELAPDIRTGIDIGHIFTTDTPVYLKRDVVQTHLFICGGIGRGKSHARGVIAEEYWAHGIPQINIDPMGELVQATDALGGINIKPGLNGFTLPLSSLQSSDLIEALPGHYTSTDYFMLIEHAHEELVKTLVLQKNQTFGLDELIDKIRELGPLLKITTSSIDKAVKRVESLKYSAKYIGKPFNWEKELNDLGKIINIDCRGYTTRDLRLITASIARDIQRLAKDKKIPFIVFSMDEAHLIAPNDDKAVTTQVLREIARIGRHYKIGLIMTTQSPADMDRAILKRLLTRMVFAIESDQLQSIRGVMSDASEDIITQLPKMPRGVCLVSGVAETIKHATLVKIRDRKTPKGGQTPDIFGELAGKGWEGRKDFPKNELPD